MLTEELKTTIDNTIKDNAGKDNIWEIYEACKRTILNCQRARLYDIDCKKYMKAISYITEKLAI